jgi:hypothetical protein
MLVWPPSIYLSADVPVLFIYALAFMPYLAASAVWIVTTLVLYEAAIYAIVRSSVAVIAALAPFAVIKNIQLGHNGF